MIGGKKEIKSTFPWDIRNHAKAELLGISNLRLLARYGKCRKRYTTRLSHLIYFFISSLSSENPKCVNHKTTGDH
jgi:hypothetical protein